MLQAEEKDNLPRCFWGSNFSISLLQMLVGRAGTPAPQELHLSHDSVILQIQRKLQPPSPFKPLLILASPTSCSMNTFLSCQPSDFTAGRSHAPCGNGAALGRLHCLAMVHARVFAKGLLHYLTCIAALHSLELYFKVLSVLPQATPLYPAFNDILFLSNNQHMGVFWVQFLFFKVDITPAAPNS